MGTFVGISGVRRNATAAVCVDGELRAVCEQERLTRTRRAGLGDRFLPGEAVATCLAQARVRPSDVTAYVIADPRHGRVEAPAAGGVEALDHAFAHAATAFFTSPFEQAVIVVCDRLSTPELSVWIGDRDTLVDQHWRWDGPGFATLYSASASLFGYGLDQAPLFEALARIGRDGATSTCRAAAAHAVQDALCRSLIGELAGIRARIPVSNLCLAGGLFYNTYLNTAIRRSGMFERTFVPVSPGNPGLAAGGALVLANREGSRSGPGSVSPFLGPGFDDEAIKETLDNCKLSYAYLREHEIVDGVVSALLNHELVGWFQGRMEWGSRALGHRSILANPLSPYVLENLNLFLRKRDLSRGYGLSVRAEDVGEHFCGPGDSPLMEYEYGLRDRERLRSVLPTGATTTRVQTVERSCGLFWDLHDAFRRRAGIGVLVHTSLNGFQEPMVCTPRDAVRVFYGTGLDMLVIGRFVLRK